MAAWSYLSGEVFAEVQLQGRLQIAKINKYILWINNILWFNRDHSIKPLIDQSFPYTLETLTPLLSDKEPNITLAVAEFISVLLALESKK